MLKLSPGQKITIEYEMNVMDDQDKEFLDDLKTVIEGDRNTPITIENLIGYTFSIQKITANPNFDRNVYGILIEGRLV